MIVELTRRMEREFTDLQSRHGRKKSPYCLCEGVRCCTEVLAAVDRSNIALAVTSGKLHGRFDFDNIDHAIVDDEKLQKLSGTITSQGILLLVKRPAVDPE